MSKRKVLIGISLGRGSIVSKNSRGGEISRPAERIELKPGDTFDFTPEEIEDITNSNPGALSTIGESNLETGKSANNEVKSVKGKSADGKSADGKKDKDADL